MYLFTSAIFFLIFFSWYKLDEKSLDTGTVIRGRSIERINKMDSATFSEFTRPLNRGEPMTREAFQRKFLDSTKTGFHFAGNYRSRQEYDSLVKAGTVKHSWLQRQFVYKNFELNEKYKSDPKLFLVAAISRFQHTLPQMLFVLLPLFAAILKLVYIRRKQFYYVDHIIFTIHLYIFIFLTMLLTFGLGKLRSTLHWEWLRYLAVVLVLAMFFYFYKALRNFYKQGRGKTILKYFILLFLFLSTTVLTFVVFFLFSIFAL